MTKKKHDKINRRSFLKTMGAAGLGPVLASTKVLAESNKPDKQTKQPTTKYPQVPRRKLGKTGIDVPCLSFGGMFNLMNSQIVLRKTLQWGVNYWDTANIYAGGNSELGIGKFLSKNPKLRKDLFIVTKATYAKSVEEVENLLHTSLKRMKTNYIDLFYGIHGMGYPSRLQLTDELRRWAKSAKKRKLIRFFGFSTHKNIAQCLSTAAKTDWIDVIMTSYNFRLMQDPRVEAAVDECHKAGIGLVAMKVTGRSVIRKLRQDFETDKDKKLIQHLLQRGFTQEQACIKLVLENEKISSACVTMQNIAHLTSNVAAVLDKTRLAKSDMDIFAEYARATCSGYCAGCADICESALPDMPYVSDIMRYLMYYNSYGDKDRAKELFAQIPADIRSKLLSIDYSPAEARCPQRIPIKEFVAEAINKLT